MLCFLLNCGKVAAIMSEVIAGYPPALANRGIDVGDLTERWKEYVSGRSLTDIREQIEGGVENIDGNRVFISRGDNKNALNLTYPEFSVAMLPRYVMAACFARDYVRDTTGRDATVALIANNTKGETYINPSAWDKTRTLFGSSQPMVEIGKRVRDRLGNPRDNITIGASLGAIAAMTDLAEQQGGAGVLIEAPNVLWRDPIRLLANTIGNGADGEELIRDMYAETNPELYKEIMEYKPGEDNQFMIGMLRNLHTLGPLCVGNAGSLVKQGLDRRNSVVQAYGNVDKVSPFKRNERLREKFKAYSNYAAVPSLQDKVKRGLAQHSMSGDAPFVAALTRVGYELPRAA